MTDLVLIQNGVAHEIVRNTTKAAFCYETPEGESEPRPKFHPDVVAAYVEVESDTVFEDYAWNGSAFVPPALSHEVLSQYAATKRYEAETSGILVGGNAIRTDRESQAMITGAFAFSQIAPDGTEIKFKTAAGFAVLSKSDVAAVALAVAQHVQACFAKEADVVASIAIDEITTRAEIDAAFASLA